MPSAKPLNSYTDSESVSRVHLHLLAALRSSGASHDLGGGAERDSWRPLEVVQLQCMAQSLQIGSTGNPPERHVLLRKQK